MKSGQRLRRQFASDNQAGICPEAFAAMVDANRAHAISYGDDPWTPRAVEVFRDLFETRCEVFFVFNGTAANALALSAICHSYHSVLCHEHAHIETGECGATPFFGHGVKPQLLPGENGKLDAKTAEQFLKRPPDVHFFKPRAVSITQATEGGTVYSPEEVRALSRIARRAGLALHMDGARFANAVAASGVSPADLTWRAGVDVLTFGGSKNGMALGEAVVFFNRGLAREFEYRRKQAGQLASKMRFLAAPWIGMLRGGAWLRHARHANSMARHLETGLRGLPGLKLIFPRQTNAVFVKMPPAVIRGLYRRGWFFYTHVNPDDCRLMCSWDTTRADVDELIADIKRLLRAH
jgi:threonine aldolase